MLRHSLRIDYKQITSLHSCRRVIQSSADVIWRHMTLGDARHWPRGVERARWGRRDEMQRRKDIGLRCAVRSRILGCCHAKWLPEVERKAIDNRVNKITINTRGMTALAADDDELLLVRRPDVTSLCVTTTDTQNMLSINWKGLRLIVHWYMSSLYRTAAWNRLVHSGILR